MSKALTAFQSDRRFELWRYTVSHSQLLLRSNKTNELSTRVEILFKGVDAVNLCSLLNGISIGPCPAGSPEHALVGNVDLRYRGLYRVSTNGFNGYVVAAAIFVAEDDLDYNGPSTLLTDFLI